MDLLLKSIKEEERKLGQPVRPLGTVDRNKDKDPDKEKTKMAVASMMVESPLKGRINGRLRPYWSG